MAIGTDFIADTKFQAAIAAIAATAVIVDIMVKFVTLVIVSFKNKAAMVVGIVVIEVIKVLLLGG